MGKVKAIEQAVQGLPPVDLAKFRSWFAEFDANAWDAQIAADAATGKLDALAEEERILSPWPVLGGKQTKGGR